MVHWFPGLPLFRLPSRVISKRGEALRIHVTSTSENPIINQPPAGDAHNRGVGITSGLVQHVQHVRPQPITVFRHPEAFLRYVLPVPLSNATCKEQTRAAAQSLLPSSPGVVNPHVVGLLTGRICS